MIHTMRFRALAGLWTVVLLLVACGPEAAPTLSPGVGGSVTQVVEPMPITDVQVVGLESSPPQPAADVEGMIGDSCSMLDSETQSRDGTTISIQINVRRTMDPRQPCAEMAQMYDQTLPLEGDFPPGTYTLIVNGTAVTFSVVAAGTPTPTPRPTQAGDCTYDAQIVEDVSLPEDLSIVPGETFAKTWRVLNTGTCAWDSTFSWAKVEGDSVQVEPPETGLVPLPETPPGKVADVAVELVILPGTALGSQQEARFQARTPDGQFFGPEASLQVTVADPSVCKSDSEFVLDVSIPDGSEMTPGQSFVKTWRIRNTGTCTWDNTYTLVQIKGDTIHPTTGPDPIPLTDLIPGETVGPGERVDLSIELALSPDAPVGSRQEARFQIHDPDGDSFGTQPFVLVEVVPPQ